LAQIGAEKCRRRQHHGYAVTLDQLSDLFGFERIRVGEGADAFEERIEQRDGASEAVEKWKRREQESVLRRIAGDRELRNVAQDVAMTEDDTLRFSGAATGEKQDRLGVIAHAW